MKIIQSILTNNPCYKAGKKITVKGLMLHSVGCPQPKVSVFIKNWNRADYDRACVHAFIDGNTGDVYQTLPWNHRGWHGGGTCNNTHIGVEMCEPACIEYTSGSKFTCSDMTTARAVVQRTYDNAVALFAHLCKEYKLDPLADGVIISHKEGGKSGVASNHGDPEHLWNGLGMGYTMDTFRKAVKAAMGGEDKTTKKPDVIYQVYAGGKWWGEIKNYNTTNSNGYAGVLGKEISGIRVKLSNGKTVTVRSHISGKARTDWLAAITKWDDTSNGYSGWKGKPTDCIAMKADGHTLKYRVHIKGGEWLSWVSEYDITDYNNGLAGAYGKPIDAVQIAVVK